MKTYLVEGSERAVLIDTGCGLANHRIEGLPAKGPMVEGFMVGMPVDERNNRVDGGVFNCIYPGDHAK